MKNNTIQKDLLPFTQIVNELLNDNRISFKAKGIYAFMFSKPNNWNFTIKSMAKQSKEGVNAIAEGLKELKQIGWVDYKKYPNGEGRYYLNTKPKTTKS